MTTLLIDRSGAQHEVERARIVEPVNGVWHVLVKLVTEGSGVTGKCVLRTGSQDWVGTIDPEFSGAWGGSYTLRLVGGAHGWCQPISAKGYHSDAGVKARTVAADAASACGETLAAFDPTHTVGLDYARPSGEASPGTASATLESVVGSAIWWVGRDGKTRVGTRASGKVAQVLDWLPSSKTATIDGEDLTLVHPGYTITDERIGGTQTIREVEVRLEGATVRVYAWCGGLDAKAARLPRLLAALVQHVAEGPLWGSYRYRVVSQNSDGRLNLQAVNKASGVPDLLPLTPWPGIPGATFEITEGSEVLVEFEGGNRGKPFVSKFDQSVPVSLSLCGGTRPASGVGDEVTVFMSTSPVMLVGTVTPPTGTPMQFTGTGVFDTPLLGIITTGTQKVKLPT